MVGEMDTRYERLDGVRVCEGVQGRSGVRSYGEFAMNWFRS